MRTRRTPARILIATAAVATLLLTGCTAASAGADSSPSVSTPAVVAPAGADGYGLVTGTGPVAVNLWTDLSCPYCRALELATGATLADAIDAGRVTLTIHPLNFVSDKHGDETDWSTRAANALAAVADAGEADTLPALYALLQEHQTDDADAHPTDAEIVAFAAEAGVSADLTAAVDEQRFGAWIDASNTYWLGRTIEGTEKVVEGVPILVVDGQVLDLEGDDVAGALTAAIDAAS